MRKRTLIAVVSALVFVGLGLVYHQRHKVGVVEVSDGQSPPKTEPQPVVRSKAEAKRVPLAESACIVHIADGADPGHGIAEAQVRYLRHSPLMRGATVSGEDGTFLLPSPGLYSVVVQKRGFARLFVKALRCQAAQIQHKLLLAQGTRLELNLYSGQEKPSADVDVLLLPYRVQASHAWRRSTFYRGPGVLDQLERALVRFTQSTEGQSKSRGDLTTDIVERTVKRILDRNQIGPQWLPYLSDDFHRGRSDEAGLVVWDGIPGDFRWGILSNELTAEMNPPIEGRESLAAPSGGIIPARWVPQNLSGIVKERPGETIRLRAVVNVGNWVRARLIVPKGYRPLRRIMLLSRIDEVKNGQKLVRFVAEHRSEIDAEGVCVFHGVRPGPKVLKAWMEKRAVPAYRFYSRAFHYKGGQLDLGRVVADLRSGDAMLGVRIQGDPGRAQEITAFDLSLLLVAPSEVGGGHYKLDLEIQPGKLLRLEGQKGRQAYPTLKTVLRRGAQRIVLKREMTPIDSLKPLHWIDAEILSPVLSKVRIEYAPGLGPEKSTIMATVLDESGGRDRGAAQPKDAANWAEYRVKGTRPGFYAFAVQYGARGKMAAGLATFQRDLAKIRLQRGETLDVLVGAGRKSGAGSGQSPWIRLVPEVLADKDILHSPFVKQAKKGKCHFEHIPVPGRYWIYVNDKKRKLIDFKRYLEIDLR